jgi:nicotinamidase/pyrazinamidase
MWIFQSIIKVTHMSKTYNLTSQDALLITDIQIDFLPGGALPVEGGDEIIPVINEYIKHFVASKARIIVSRDWHPPNHMSFKPQGGPWPPHCVQNTEGAKFSPNLKLPRDVIIVSKATDPKREAYSAFDSTNLDNQLQQLGVTRLFVCGLATDYCVVNTVFDACKLGFQTVVLMDAIMGIDVRAGDVDRAVEAMIKSGAEQATDADFAEVQDTLPVEEASSDALAEKPSMIVDAKKKARMRSRSVKKQIKTER